MLRSLLILVFVLGSIYWLTSYPVDDMRSLLATIGAMVLVVLAAAGLVSLIGQVHWWLIRRSIRRDMREGR